MGDYITISEYQGSVMIDSAGNHPIKLTLEQVGKLHKKIEDFLMEKTIKNPPHTSSGPKIPCS